MICHEFKGGIGTSSRLVETGSGQFTVGALVQANYGARADLRVDGVPVGLEIGQQVTPYPGNTGVGGGSIIIIVRYGCASATHPVPAASQARHRRLLQSRRVGT